MFTGIITHLGKIVTATGSNLIIETDKELIHGLSKGGSVAVNGICLTVVSLIGNSFSIDFIPETAKKTNIKYWQIGNIVNLEVPATANSLLSGHIIQGHIDTVAKLVTMAKEGNSHILKFAVSKALTKYIVEKGSIAINGISLTVIKAGKDFFTVGIIPRTWDKTMLHIIKLGDFFNIEVDILAKYVEKMIKV